MVCKKGTGGAAIAGACGAGEGSFWMRCPFCRTNNDRVIDSRTSGDATLIRRRRQCLECLRRFTTYERIEESRLRVVKKDGARVPFDRRKILAGLLKACEKRPISMDQLEEVCQRIEQKLSETFDREVSSQFIGNLVMQELRELDPVAYVRFASVYREFKDVDQFLSELRPLLKRGSDRGDGAVRG